MRARSLSFLPVLLVVAAACGGGGGGGSPDAGPPLVDASPDAPPGGTEVVCGTLPTPSSGACDVTVGNTATLLEGTVLTPGKVYRGGKVAIDAAGQISCVGCDCGVGGETIINCGDAVVSPGLINTHDHITFTQNNPYTDSGERYEQRHDWRKGLNGHTKISSAGAATGAQVSWGELRFLMGGATSIVGSGGAAGLVRNLDKTTQEGLNHTPVKFDTFPLDDSGGTQLASTCNYGAMPTTMASLANEVAYEPHTAEGIDAYAHNEFLCESSKDYDTMAPGLSDNLLLPKTALIHAVGLGAYDYGVMAASNTSLIWSPRSNVTLYGDTAQVTTAKRVGVQIALGTDWMPTGSMNLLRELACADSLNRTYYDHAFTDEDLWRMVTINAATVTATADAIGVLAPSRIADIAVFASHGKAPYRAVIEAAPEDVALVMRGGKVLYGDAAPVGQLSSGCDTVDVCGTSKQVCLVAEVGKSYADLKTAAGTAYPAFACGTPMNEPSCVPKRPKSVAGSTVYTGAVTADDQDGDGIANAMDDCPSVFNPIRPLDNGHQADYDQDGVGDACDVCPQDAGSTTCTAVDPNDRDHDGVANAADNCPDVANPTQADADADAKGDACDPCPMAKNPGNAGCPRTIYDVKSGAAAVGSMVRIAGALVTGKGSNGFFVQVKETDAGYQGADNSGLFVFTGPGTATLAAAVVGTRVTIDGTVAVYQGQVEISPATAVTAETTTVEAAPMPVAATYAEVATGGARAAKLESVLVKLGASAVSAVDATVGEFTVTAGAATLVVDDYLLPATNPAVGKNFSSLTGVLAMRQMASKLEPRSATDLVSGAPALAPFAVGPYFAYVGQAATAPGALRVTLTSPAVAPVQVTFTSSDAGKLTAAPVDFAVGETAHDVALTATAAAAAVTLTAKLAGAADQAVVVRVLAAGTVPQAVTISPAAATVAPFGTVAYEVALDVPAPAGGTMVTLSVAPATAGTAPLIAAVPAGQLAGAFTYADLGTGAAATVTARLGASAAVSTVTVAAGAGHLVINEVDYDQVGTDAAEYVELYNPTGGPISLAGKQLVLVNGADSTAYDTIDLGPAGTLASHQYLVVAGAGVSAPASALKLEVAWTSNALQNGAPDGVALIDTASSTLVDALSYEGSIAAANLPGFAAPQSLVEGTALAASVADSNTAPGALCRLPDGGDTDVASADWKFCARATPGEANALN